MIIIKRNCEETDGIIYLATFPNNKYYVGQSFYSLEKRMKEHKYASKKHDYPVYRAIRKYGFENIKWEIIDKANNADELNKKEIYWISYYRSYVGFENSQGYNANLGGGRNAVFGSLNDKELEELGKDFKNGMSKKEIKEKYNIEHDWTVNAICAGRIWKEFTKIPERDFSVWKRGTSLTPEQVDDILEDFKKSGDTRTIADKMGVKVRTITNIVKGITWSEYTDIKDETFYLKYKRASKYINNEDLIKIGKMWKEGKEYEDISKKFPKLESSYLHRILNGKILSNITGIKSNSKEKRLKIGREKVKNIVKLKEKGLTHNQIAKELQVSRSTVQDVLYGKRWKEISGINNK